MTTRCRGFCELALLWLAARCRRLADRRRASGARWMAWAAHLERMAERRT